MEVDTDTQATPTAVVPPGRPGLGGTPVGGAPRARSGRGRRVHRPTTCDGSWPRPRRCPDHGDLRPWRFAVSSGAGRDRFGDALVAGLVESRGDDLPDAVVAKMRSKAFAAPCAVLLIASPDPTSNVEVWEQVASASCTGYAVVLAATGLGYGAVWKSAAVLGTAPVRELFGLGPNESLLGWVNLGTPAPLGRKKRGVDHADPLAGLVVTLGG